MSDEQKPPPQDRMWALVIGINEYRSIQPPLRGAIADAEAMANFLESRLSVPSSQIRILKGSNATRQNILSAFQEHFTDNPEIKDGDPIVFFFAGHGTQSKAPTGWTTDDGMVEAICPWDESVVGDTGRNPVYGIPDRTIWALLHELAHRKGNNITAILDCCHSGSGSRGQEETLRYHQKPLTIPFEQDEGIWGKFFPREFKAFIPSGFRFGNMSSHVLLAACRQDELARENEYSGVPRGNFTYALLSTLEQNGIRITYADLVRRLPPMSSPYQRPQCEGNHKDCWIFTVEGDKSTRLFEVARNATDGALEVEAGIVHGVVPGTEFTLFLVNDSTTQPVGQMKAGAVEQQSTTLVPAEDWTGEPFVLQSGLTAYARISAYRNPLAELKVFFDAPPPSALNALVSRLSQRFGTQAIGHSEFGVYLTYNREEADFIVREETTASAGKRNVQVRPPKSTVRLERTAKFLPIPGYSSVHTHTNIPNDHKTIFFILHAAAHFKFHVLRQNPIQPLIKHVDLELYRVTNTRNPLPEGRDLLKKPAEGEATQYTGSKAELEFERDALYGITLHNRSPYDLFPFVFVFDLNTYQVYGWYKPAARTAASPLKKVRPGPQGSMLTIGHGSHNADPIQFTLDDGQKSDTTFVKLLISNQNTKLESVEQNDVFEDIAKMAASALPDVMSRVASRKQTRRDIWDTQLAKVTYARS